MRIGILWRAEWDPVVAGRPIPENTKLHRVFTALTALGVAAEPVVYSDDRVEEVRAQLLELDGVLVWVNPIQEGLDRSKLDPLLAEVAGAGLSPGSIGRERAARVEAVPGHGRHGSLEGRAGR